MISTPRPASGLWSVHVDSGVATRVIPGRDLRITSVSLGYIVANQQQRTTLQLTYRPQGMEEALKPTICSLLAGKIEQASCDLVLEANREFIFDVFGENSVDIVGNYIEYDDDDGEEEDMPMTTIEFHGRNVASSQNFEFVKKPNLKEEGDDTSSVGSTLGKRRSTTRKPSVTATAPKPSKKAKTEGGR